MRRLALFAVGIIWIHESGYHKNMGMSKMATHQSRELIMESIMRSQSSPSSQ